MRCLGDVLPRVEPNQTQDTLKSSISCLAGNASVSPPKELDEMVKVRKVLASQLKLLISRPKPR